jgi:hypothetical protein
MFSSPLFEGMFLGGDLTNMFVRYDSDERLWKASRQKETSFNFFKVV